MQEDTDRFEIKAHAGTIREVLALSAPLMIAHLSQSMMWVVDTFVMGRVGNAEQGAVGLAGVLVWASVCFFAGTMTVVNILVAQDYGAGKHDLARHVRTGLLLALPMSALVFAMHPLVPHGLAMMHVADATRPFAETYLQIRLLSAPLMIGSFVLASYLRGVGDTITPMIVVLAANVINAVVSVVLVFGWLGFPAMGVAGAALGSVAASAAELVLYAAVFWFGKRSRANGSRILSLPDRGELRQFLTLGAPIGLAWLFEMVAWTSFSIYAGSRPPEELAAHTVLFQVTGFCFMPAMAIGLAASTLVGQYLGANRKDLASRAGRNALALGVAYMAVVGAALALCREPLMLAFNNDRNVVALGVSLALLAAIYQPFDGFGILAQGVLRGAKLTAVPTVITLGSGLFVFIPLVWLLGEAQGLGVTGAWIAAVVHVVLVSVLLGFALMRVGPFARSQPVKPVVSAA